MLKYKEVLKGVSKGLTPLCKRKKQRHNTSSLKKKMIRKEIKIKTDIRKK
jgi:hypothetical protein